ncbi:hypothetical protein [Haloarcula amylovorans]|uniref:hypothetical protein n=1 Tax=Haloarcula amylovorans TaxID=2562280 RepID=UPI0010763056|nr:hypothetical protein [Halomicroarcula amylolytica]
MSKQQTVNPNSALYWYPKLEAVAGDLPVSVPESTFVEYDFLDSFALLDGEMPDTLPWGEFIEAVEAIGTPAFLRTDQKSVKHAGPSAYKATDPGEDVPTIVAVLTDFHVKSNRHPAALMVREFVDINGQFRAFDGLPIGSELRVFARPSIAECDHFYWPAEAIGGGRGQPTTMDGDTELPESAWRTRLTNARSSAFADVEMLRSAATETATALNDSEQVPDDETWSVDFARDTDGEWWLLDVALAADSWHPDHDGGDE